MFSIFSILFNVNTNSEITVQKIHEKMQVLLIGPYALTSFNFKLNITISHFSLKENSTCSFSLLSLFLQSILFNASKKSTRLSDAQKTKETYSINYFRGELRISLVKQPQCFSAARISTQAVPSRGAGGAEAPTQTKICGGRGTAPHILLPTKIASDCGIGDIRAHIFCPQMTQELAKYTIKQDRLNNCLYRQLSQIDCGHTRH